MTPLVDRDAQPDDCEHGPTSATSGDVRVTLLSATAFAGFFFPALAGLLFGYDIGSTSGAILSLQGTLPDGTNSPLLSSVLHSASLMGALAGTLATFVVATPLGRRREVMVGAIFYLLGTTITVLGLGGPGARIGTVIGGRIVYGLGIALCMHAAPVYIAEVTPSRVRGLFVSLKEGFIVTGIMLGFAASAIFKRPNAWQWIWYFIFLESNRMTPKSSALPLPLPSGVGLIPTPTSK